MTTYYAVTVDTEEEWDWSTGFPIRTPSVTNIRELPRFDSICAQRGAAVTYFTNYAVLDNSESCRTVLDLAHRPGVEIGMHIHPWNTPPIDSSETPCDRTSFLANFPSDLIRAKLKSTYNRFVKLGLAPKSFRGGRYSSGGDIHRFLQEKGFNVDASVVPFTTWPDEGAPDYRDRDLYPRRIPNRHSGGQPLWEIPLTLAYTRSPQRFWRRAFEIVENTPLRSLRLIGLAQRLRLVERIWLNFECATGRNMVSLLKHLRQWKLPCICFTLHSSSLMVGGNCYTPNRSAQQRLLRQVEDVLTMLAGWDEFQPATITQIGEILEREYQYENSGNQSFGQRCDCILR